MKPKLYIWGFEIDSPASDMVLQKEMMLSHDSYQFIKQSGQLGFILLERLSRGETSNEKHQREEKSSLGVKKTFHAFVRVVFSDVHGGSVESVALSFTRRRRHDRARAHSAGDGSSFELRRQQLEMT